MEYVLISNFQSVGKEMIDMNNPTITGGNGKTRYFFSAFNPGTPKLTFEYGYATSKFCQKIRCYKTLTNALTKAVCRPKSPGADDTIYRVTVHITIKKLLTSLPPVLQPITNPVMPSPIPAPLAPIEAYLSASSEGPPYAVSASMC
jgi:hypothetical protein